MNLDLLTFAGAGLAVLVCTVLIRLWRLHGGHDHLPGDVLWAGVVTLCACGWIARSAHRHELAVACLLATAGLWAGSVLVIRRRSRRRSSLSRYYSN